MSDELLIDSIIQKIKGIAFDAELMPLFDLLEQYGVWDNKKILNKLDSVRDKVRAAQQQQAVKNEDRFTRDFIDLGIGSINGQKSALVKFITTIGKDEYQFDQNRTRYVMIINDDPEGKMLMSNFTVQYAFREERDQEYKRIKNALKQYANIRFL